MKEIKTLPLSDLDSTNVSGIVLSKLPLGYFAGMVRYKTENYSGIAIAWKGMHTNNTFSLSYYDVLTGDKVNEEYVNAEYAKGN